MVHVGTRSHVVPPFKYREPLIAIHNYGNEVCLFWLEAIWNGFGSGSFVLLATGTWLLCSFGVVMS